MMEEVESWRPFTPSQNLDASPGDSPKHGHLHSPSQKVSARSPENNSGGNLSSLSSRNSSLSRSQSKASLRSFFSRGRSVSSASQRPDTSASRNTAAIASRKHSRHSSGSVVRAESPHLSQIGSRLDNYRPTQVTHATHIERARSKQQRLRPSPSWDPPPLFQAYPQSRKHATLDAPCLSADIILRRGSYRDSRNPDDSAKADLMDAQNRGAVLKKARGSPTKQARKLSASIKSGGWTKHLFVLVDSGYLLQYAGGGHHDRLPEKMMQLGKDTVAFASDAIPGRHWVLQVSQALGEDAIVVSESSKGILSRIGVQSSESRRTTQNFLMVFDNAEDLDSWLTTIRREVEALGGRQCRPETPTAVEARSLRSYSPVRRASEEKDTYQFPGNKFRSHEHILSPVESEFAEDDGGHVTDQMLGFRFWDDENTSQHTEEDSSTITSTDLDRLRDSKDSSGSTDSGASLSFPGHSPSSSLGCDAFAVRPFPSFESTDASSIRDARTRNSQVQEWTLFEEQSPTFLCHALNVVDLGELTHTDTRASLSNVKRLSNTVPNFSIPISSNRLSFFGSPEALDKGMSRGTTTTNSPGPENESFDDDSTEDDSFPRRPVSTIAPLPTHEALMNPTGMRTRTLRRPSTEKPVALHPPAVHQSSTSSFLSYDNEPSSRHKSTRTHGPFTSLQNAIPTPSPRRQTEFPALSRSRSYQGLSTFYDSGHVASPITLSATSSQDQSQELPLGLSGFPELPSSGQPITRPRTDREDQGSWVHVKPFAPSTVASLPTVTITGASPGVNSRLSRIRDLRGLPNLGMIPPSGPPPNCPLPDTPSPRKRHFRPLSTGDARFERSRFDVLPQSTTSFS